MTFHDRVMNYKEEQLMAHREPKYLFIGDLAHQELRSAVKYFYNKPPRNCDGMDYAGLQVVVVDRPNFLLVR